MSHEYSWPIPTFTHRLKEFAGIIPIKPIVKLGAKTHLEQHRNGVKSSGNDQGPKNLQDRIGTTEELSANEKRNQSYKTKFYIRQSVIKTYPWYGDVSKNNCVTVI